MHGGDIVAQVLSEEKVRFLFTLCGGHISPILVSAKHSGIHVIDTRHEVNAVFAADAVARITGIPGVVAVTAGPGITNTLTAVRNALMAQSPLVILGGAAPTLLKGRGALQDIDQMTIMRPNVKWAAAVRTVRSIYPTLKRAFRTALDGVPGPVFVELPLDLLYPESTVRSGFEKSFKKPKAFSQRITSWYVQRHLNNVFRKSARPSRPIGAALASVPSYSASAVEEALSLLKNAHRPVLLTGSGALMIPSLAHNIANAITQLGLPTYLSGMARGLLGQSNPLQFRHHRKESLREADLVILAGVPCDFRLEYGRHISHRAKVLSINRSRIDLTQNRKPTLGILADPGQFLIQLGDQASKAGSSNYEEWKETLYAREQHREEEIHRTGSNANGLHPVQLLRELDKILPNGSVVVADGGDFVATSSYVLRPRDPLSWLDPGVFGTLGIGGGFALGAKLCNPEAEVYIVYGDGSAAYSLMEFDTFVRHKLPVIAIIGNDASWSQIARDQVDILKDDCGTVLDYSNYEKVAQAFGGNGRRVSTLPEFVNALEEGQKSIRNGVPYLINAIIQKSDFRKGSLSM